MSEMKSIAKNHIKTNGRVEGSEYRAYYYSRSASFKDGVQQAQDFEGLQETLAFISQHPQVEVLNYHKFAILLYLPQGYETPGIKEIQTFLNERVSPHLKLGDMGYDYGANVLAA